MSFTDLPGYCRVDVTGEVLMVMLVSSGGTADADGEDEGVAVVVVETVETDVESVDVCVW